MNNYFFVAPSLPSLVLGEEPDMTFEEVMHRLEMNLSKDDYAKVEALRRFVDLCNIRALYQEKSLDPHGNMSEKELDEALLVKAFLPEYVFDFLDRYDNTKDAARHFHGLLAEYFNEEIQREKGFLRELFVFQREIRLVLLAYRCKKVGRDVVDELQFEDFSDPLVAQILAQKDMETYQPPVEYEDLLKELDGVGDDPLQQHRIVIQYEFDRIEEKTGYPLFSLDWILGYVAQLMLLERWMRLDPERGSEIAHKYKTG